ncbi:MAG: DUF2550 domain-containing protein [Nocardioides sp.]|nr:DUF2550 domain-containing protein [Nocardioides sp.]
MHWWEILLALAALVLLLVLAYGIGLSARRRHLLGRGAFELSHRVRDTRPGRGWALGVGIYTDEELEWFRVFSLSPKPRRIWNRVDLSYVSSRSPEGVEELALYPDQLIVTCEIQGTPIDLGMTKTTLIGFQAWLESRRPRTNPVL